MLEIKEIKERLKVGEVYKYAELCLALDEDVKRNNSKKAQLKRWSCLFEWDNPTTQTYLITKIYDEEKEIEDKRKNNGGLRDGSGAKVKAKEEYDWLINAFVNQEFSRNEYNSRPMFCVAYFSNSKIGRYFGLHSDRFYDGKNDDYDLFGQVNHQLLDRRKRWIIDKIKEDDRFEYSHGILAYRSRDDWNDYDIKDEWEDRWLEYQREYLALNNMTIAKVMEYELWNEMEDYISSKFDGYERVSRVNKIEFDAKVMQEYDVRELYSWKAKFNAKVVDSVWKSLQKKGVDAEEFLMEYVVLDGVAWTENL